MSCNCSGCGQPERLCRCPKGKGEAPRRAYIAECTDCDPCRPCKSMVKICSFVAPTLTEGQVFHNSFVYNQEDDSVYYISDDGTPTRFGSSPMFIDAFNPDDRKIPRQTVFDFANQKAYVYDPEGNYITIDLAGGDTPAPTSNEKHIRVEVDLTSKGGLELNTGAMTEEYYQPVALGFSSVTYTDVDTNTVMTEAEVIDALQNYDVYFENMPVGYYGEIDPGTQELGELSLYVPTSTVHITNKQIDDSDPSGSQAFYLGSTPALFGKMAQSISGGENFISGAMVAIPTGGTAILMLVVGGIVEMPN